MDVLAFLEPGAVALLIALLIGGVGILASGKIVVPRWFYDKEVARGDKLQEALTASTVALNNLTDEIRYSQRKGS